MRYIDMVRLLEERDDWPPKGWEERVQQAEEELRNPPPDRTWAKIFEKYSDLWSEVKEQFRQISHEKCWYCESRTDRNRGDMDHQRPKGGVTDSDHPGYWWLAFKWRNWRFSCEICNSKLRDRATGSVGGKGNEFPLVDGERRRICSEHEYDDYEDLLEEDPLLLDPTEPGDPQLLTFRSDGRPAPVAEEQIAEGETPVDYRRAKESIRIYHLDHSKLNRRRRTIYGRVRKLVTTYRKYQPIWERDRSNLAARMLAKQAMSDLREMIASDAAYSEAARTYLVEYRMMPRDWVDRLLTGS
jgi:uncharacterized protein (TIGR02646 family)